MCSRQIGMIIQAKAQSVNSFYTVVRHGMIITPKGRQWKRDIQNRVKKLMPNENSKIRGNVELDVTFGFADKRIRDVDNYLKPFIDAIKDIVFEDDSNIIHLKADKVISDNKTNFIKFHVSKI